MHLAAAEFHGAYLAQSEMPAIKGFGSYIQYLCKNATFKGNTCGIFIHQQGRHHKSDGHSFNIFTAELVCCSSKGTTCAGARGHDPYLEFVETLLETSALSDISFQSAAPGESLRVHRFILSARCAALGKPSISTHLRSVPRYCPSPPLLPLMLPSIDIPQQQIPPPSRLTRSTQGCHSVAPNLQ